MGSKTKTFTFEEVAKHNSKTDCWIIVNGKVYDVTPFLDDHPGGDEPILSATEKDATSEFEDIGHSEDAIEMMRTYYVGEVDTNTIPAKVNSSQPTQATTYNNQSSGFVGKILQFFVPLVILGFAFALQYYGKKASPTNHKNLI